MAGIFSPIQEAQIRFNQFKARLEQIKSDPSFNKFWEESPDTKKVRVNGVSLEDFLSYGENFSSLSSNRSISDSTVINFNTQIDSWTMFLNHQIEKFENLPDNKAKIESILHRGFNADANVTLPSKIAQPSMNQTGAVKAKPSATTDQAAAQAQTATPAPAPATAVPVKKPETNLGAAAAATPPKTEGPGPGPGPVAAPAKTPAAAAAVPGGQPEQPAAPGPGPVAAASPAQPVGVLPSLHYHDVAMQIYNKLMNMDVNSPIYKLFNELWSEMVKRHAITKEIYHELQFTDVASLPADNTPESNEIWLKNNKDKILNQIDAFIAQKKGLAGPNAAVHPNFPAAPAAPARATPAPVAPVAVARTAQSALPATELDAIKNFFNTQFKGSISWPSTSPGANDAIALESLTLDADRAKKMKEALLSQFPDDMNLISCISVYRSKANTKLAYFSIDIERFKKSELWEKIWKIQAHPVQPARTAVPPAAPIAASIPRTVGTPTPEVSAARTQRTTAQAAQSPASEAARPVQPIVQGSRQTNLTTAATVEQALKRYGDLLEKVEKESRNNKKFEKIWKKRIKEMDWKKFNKFFKTIVENRNPRKVLTIFENDIRKWEKEFESLKIQSQPAAAMRARVAQPAGVATPAPAERKAQQERASAAAAAAPARPVQSAPAAAAVSIPAAQAAPGPGPGAAAAPASPTAAPAMEAPPRRVAAQPAKPVTDLDVVKDFFYKILNRESQWEPSLSNSGAIISIQRAMEYSEAEKLKQELTKLKIPNDHISVTRMTNKNMATISIDIEKLKKTDIWKKQAIAAQPAPAAPAFTREPAPAPAAAPARKQAAPAAAVPTTEVPFTNIVARMKIIYEDNGIPLPPQKREKLLEFYNNIIKNMKAYPGINYNLIKKMNYKLPRFGTDANNNAINLDIWIENQLLPLLKQLTHQIAAMEKQQASQGQAQPAAAAAASPAQPQRAAAPAAGASAGVETLDLAARAVTLDYYELSSAVYNQFKERVGDEPEYTEYVRLWNEMGKRYDKDRDINITEKFKFTNIEPLPTSGDPISNKNWLNKNRENILKQLDAFIARNKVAAGPVADASVAARSAQPERVAAPAAQPASPGPGVASPVAGPRVPPIGPEVGRTAATPAERKRGRESIENVEAAQAISNLESLLEQIKPYQDSQFFKDYFEKQTIKDPKARLEHYISQLKANPVGFIPSANALYKELNKKLGEFEWDHSDEIDSYVSREPRIAPAAAASPAAVAAAAGSPKDISLQNFLKQFRKVMINNPMTEDANKNFVAFVFGYEEEFENYKGIIDPDLIIIRGFSGFPTFTENAKQNEEILENWIRSVYVNSISPQVETQYANAFRENYRKLQVSPGQSAPAPTAVAAAPAPAAARPAQPQNVATSAAGASAGVGAQLGHVAAAAPASPAVGPRVPSPPEVGRAAAPPGVGPSAQPASVEPLGRSEPTEERKRRISEELEESDPYFGAELKLRALLSRMDKYKNTTIFKSKVPSAKMTDPYATVEQSLKNLKEHRDELSLESANRLYNLLDPRLKEFEIAHGFMRPTIEDMDESIPEVVEAIPEEESIPSEEFEELFAKIIENQNIVKNYKPYAVTYTIDELRMKYKFYSSKEGDLEAFKDTCQRYIKRTNEYIKDTLEAVIDPQSILIEIQRRINNDITRYDEQTSIIIRRVEQLKAELDHLKYKHLDGATAIDDSVLTISKLEEMNGSIQQYKESNWENVLPLDHPKERFEQMEKLILSTSASLDNLEVELLKIKYKNNKEIINANYKNLIKDERDKDTVALFNKYRALETQIDRMLNSRISGLWKRVYGGTKGLLAKYKELEKASILLVEAIKKKRPDATALRDVVISEGVRETIRSDEVKAEQEAEAAAEGADADEADADADADADEAVELAAEAADEPEAEIAAEAERLPEHDRKAPATSPDEWDVDMDDEPEEKHGAEVRERSRGPQLFTGGEGLRSRSSQGDLQQRFGQLGGTFEQNRASGRSLDGDDGAPRVTPQRKGAVHRQREVDSREELLRISNPITEQQFEQHAVASFEKLQDLIENDPEYVGSTLQRGSTATNFTLTIPDEENDREDTLSRKIKHGKLNADLTIPPSDKALFLMLESMRGLNPTLKRFSKPTQPNEPHDEEAEKILIRLLQASLKSGIKVNFAEEDQEILENNEVYRYMKDNDCLGDNDIEYGDNFRGLIEEEDEKNDENNQPPYKLGENFSDMERMLHMRPGPRRPSTP